MKKKNWRKKKNRQMGRLFSGFLQAAREHCVALGGIYLFPEESSLFSVEREAHLSGHWIQPICNSPVALSLIAPKP
jgi:hypothetical protein